MHWKWLVLAVPIICSAESASDMRGVLQLSLKRAVEMAISPEGSTGIQLAEQSVKQAQARSGQARAPLLPNFDVGLAGENATHSLTALGIPTGLPFLPLPRIGGPLNTFDFRTSATQSIFDMGARRRFRASRLEIGAARSGQMEAEDRVATDVAKAYVAALRAEARLDAIRANIALAEAVLKQAQNQNLAGVGTGIEITRAKVQLSSEQHRRSIAENEKKRTYLQLLRVVGLRLDTSIELTDALSAVPLETSATEQLVEEALRNRPDVKTQHEREATARMSAGAAGAERWPTVAAFADYGPIGTSFMSWAPTRTYGLAIRFPLFDGGRRSARQAEVESKFAEEQIRTHDLKDQVEMDVRLALESFRSADEQVKVGTEGLALAEEELTQARRRYIAGVTNSLEVADAQTRLDLAHDNYIDALFNDNQAAIELAQATGTIQQIVNRFQRLTPPQPVIALEPDRAADEPIKAGADVSAEVNSLPPPPLTAAPAADAGPSGARSEQAVPDLPAPAPAATTESSQAVTSVAQAPLPPAETQAAPTSPPAPPPTPAPFADAGFSGARSEQAVPDLPAPTPAATTEGSQAVTSVAQAPLPPAETQAAPARFGVQAATFRNRENAERFLQQTETTIGPSCIVAGDGNPKLWRVMVGPVPSKEAAESLARKISEQMKTAAFAAPPGASVCSPE